MPGESRRHHPDDRPHLAVEDHRLSDNVRIGVELADPEPVPQHDDRRRIQPGILRARRPANHGAQPHEVEEIRRHPDRPHGLDPIRGFVHHSLAASANDVFEHAAVVPEVQEFGRGKHHPRDAPLPVVHQHVHEPAGIPVRQRIQQDVVEHAVDHRHGADAEREGEHGGGGESRRPGERADGVLDITPAVLEPGEWPLVAIELLHVTPNFRQPFALSGERAMVRR